MWLTEEERKELAVEKQRKDDMRKLKLLKELSKGYEQRRGFTLKAPTPEYKKMVQKAIDFEVKREWALKH